MGRGKQTNKQTNKPILALVNSTSFFQSKNKQIQETVPFDKSQIPFYATRPSKERPERIPTFWTIHVNHNYTSNCVGKELLDPQFAGKKFRLVKKRSDPERKKNGESMMKWLKLSCWDVFQFRSNFRARWLVFALSSFLCGYYFYISLKSCFLRPYKTACHIRSMLEGTASTEFQISHKKLFASKHKSACSLRDCDFSVFVSIYFMPSRFLLIFIIIIHL